MTVTVKDGVGNAVNGANVTLYGFSVFGGTPPITRTANGGTVTVGICSSAPSGAREGSDHEPGGVGRPAR